MLWLYKNFGAVEVYVWQIEEDNSFFLERLEMDEDAYQIFRQKYAHANAARQWLASRYLLKRALGDEDYAKIERSKEGKWYLPKDNIHFSISHADDFVAVAVCSQPVGIDIQPYSEKLSRIATKFIPLQQLDTIQTKLKEDYEDLLHFHWSAKEALFKAYGLGKLDFKQHLIVPYTTIPDRAIEKYIHIKKENFTQRYQLFCEKIDSIWLAVVTLAD